MNVLRGLRTLRALALVPWIAAAGTPAVAGAQSKETLTVFAAASLSDAFTELGHTLEQQRPGLTVRFNFAGSQQLAAQLEQGARADVFASADDRWMSYLRDRHLVSGEPAVFARNRLVVIVPKANPARIGRLKDLARGGVKLILAADAVPVGHYSRTVLQNLGRDPALGADYPRRAIANVVSEEENVKAVAGKVQLGEGDAGIVYRSDVTPAVARRVKVIEIPAEANVMAAYPMAMLDAAAAREAAQAFMDLVLSSAGQQTLARRGLIPATSPAP